MNSLKVESVLLIYQKYPQNSKWTILLLRVTVHFVNCHHPKYFLLGNVGAEKNIFE